MAYVSAGESRRREIFVQSFPVPGTQYQLSTEGGTWPRWRGDGKEIVFAASGARARLMSVAVEPSGEGLKFGAPQRLFDLGLGSFPLGSMHAAGVNGFAVSSDGQLFVVPVPRAVNADPAGSPLIVLVNWMATVRR